MTSEWRPALRHFWEAGRAAITLSSSGVTQAKKVAIVSAHCARLLFMIIAGSAEGGRAGADVAAAQPARTHIPYMRRIVRSTLRARGNALVDSLSE
jgi:hypothetical protein